MSSWSHFQIIEGFLKNWWLPGETPISGKTWRTLWDITCRKEKQQQQQNQQTIINKSDWRSQSRFKMKFRLRCLGVTKRLVYSLRTSFTTICFRFCLCWAPGGHLMTTTRHETNLIKTGYPTTFAFIHGIVVKWKDTCLKTEGIFVITAHRRRFCWIEHSNVYSIVVYTAPVMLNDLITMKTSDLLFSGKERKIILFKCQVF